MKKHENSKKENKHKKSESRFQAGDSKRFLEMMNQCCEGQAEISDCCNEMRKMWEAVQDKSQEKDRKHK